MKRTFDHVATDTFWCIQLDDDGMIIITTGARGTEGECTVIEDAFDERGMPPEVLFDELIAELDEGYEEVMPDDLLEQVEHAHEVTLSGRLRAFYARHEYKTHQGRRCVGLDCRVDFTANAVLGDFYEEFWDGESMIQLMPISSKWVGEDYEYEDEQQWIGADPALPDGPVYALYTSNAYEPVYASLDAFLADLED